MWIARLTDSQRDALKALIAAQGEVGPSLSGAYDALDLARWDDLPEAELPWDRVVELARAQGCDEADVVWDLAAGMRVRRDVREADGGGEALAAFGRQAAGAQEGRLASGELRLGRGVGRCELWHLGVAIRHPVATVDRLPTPPPLSALVLVVVEPGA